MTEPIDTAALRARWNGIGLIHGQIATADAISTIFALCDALDAARAELTKAEDACRMTSKDWAVELHARMAAERENADLLTARANDDRDYRRMLPVVEAARSFDELVDDFGVHTDHPGIVTISSMNYRNAEHYKRLNDLCNAVAEWERSQATTQPPAYEAQQEKHSDQCSPNDCRCALGDNWKRQPLPVSASAGGSTLGDARTVATSPVTAAGDQPEEERITSAPIDCGLAALVEKAAKWDAHECDTLSPEATREILDEMAAPSADTPERRKTFERVEALRKSGKFPFNESADAARFRKIEAAVEAGNTIILSALDDGTYGVGESRVDDIPVAIEAPTFAAAVDAMPEAK